jgi:hypothetical protein
MGVVIAAGTAVSVAANTKSSDQISGTYQFLPFDAMIYVIARGSATGMNIQLVSDGTNLVSDMAIPYTGTAGAISTNDHQVASFPVGRGSRTEFYLRNTTAGALTTDYLIIAEPILE